MIKKRSLLIVLLSVMMLFSAVAVIFLQTSSVKANETPAQGEILGASIKYTEGDTTKTGIRFEYLIDMTAAGINDDLSNIQNLGLVSILKDNLGENDITLGMSKSVATKFYDEGSAHATNKVNRGDYVDGVFVKSATGKQLLICVYWHSIDLSEYKATQIACAGYLQLTTESSIAYTTKDVASIGEVAKQAYQNNAHGENQSLKEFFLDCNDTYTVTLKNNGETIEERRFISGLPMDSVSNPTLNGYDFAGWTTDEGTLYTSTTPITADVTLNANFKKVYTDQTVTAYNESSTLDITDVTNVGEVLVGDRALTLNTDYVVDGTTLKINHTSLVNGNNAIKVYLDGNAYAYKEYNKIVIDSAKATSFTSLDLDHVGGTNYGIGVAGKTSIVSDTVGGRTGDFVKINVDGSTLKNPGLKVIPTVNKEVLQLYSSGSLVMDYYVDVEGFNGTVQGFVTYQTGNTNPQVLETDTFTAQAWGRMIIPVADILANEAGWEFFSTGSLSSQTWKGVVLYFGGADTKTGDIYVSELKLVPNGFFTETQTNTIVKGENETYSTAIDSKLVDLINMDGAANFVATVGDTSVSYEDDNTLALPLHTTGDTTVEVTFTQYGYPQKYTCTVVDNTIGRAYTTLDAEHVKGTAWGNTSVRTTTYVNETVGGRTGNFVKVVTDGTNTDAPGIKVIPTVTKSVLEAYKEGYVVVDYYLDLENYSANTTAVYSAGQYTDYKYTVGTAVLKQWTRVQIPVQTILDNSAVLEGNLTEHGSWKGMLIAWSDGVPAGTIYVAGLTVVPSDYENLDVLPVGDLVSMDSSYVRAGSYAVSDITSPTYNATFGDKTGLLKIPVNTTTKTSGYVYRPSLLIKPQMSLTDLQKYAGGNIVVSYYYDTTDGTATTVDLICHGTNGNPVAGKVGVSYDKWDTIIIPVDTFIANSEKFYSTDSSIDSWDKGLLYFGKVGVGDIYIESIKVVPQYKSETILKNSLTEYAIPTEDLAALQTEFTNLYAGIGNIGATDSALTVTIPSNGGIYKVYGTDKYGVQQLVYSCEILDSTATFSEVNMNNITHYIWGAIPGDGYFTNSAPVGTSDGGHNATLSTDYTDVVANPEGATGNYYKITTNQKNVWTNIRIAPTMSKATLAYYSGATFKFDIFIPQGISTTDTHTKAYWNLSEVASTATTESKWYTVEFTVDELLDMYDNLTLNNTYSLICLGKLNNVTFYIGNFRIEPATAN